MLSCLEKFNSKFLNSNYFSTQVAHEKRKKKTEKINLIPLEVVVFLFCQENTSTFSKVYTLQVYRIINNVQLLWQRVIHRQRENERQDTLMCEYIWIGVYKCVYTCVLINCRYSPWLFFQSRLELENLKLLRFCRT